MPAAEYADEIEHVHEPHSVTAALVLIALGILGIVLTGYFLGKSAHNVVGQLGVPQWAVGWILGLLSALGRVVRTAAQGRKDRKAAQRAASLGVDKVLVTITHTHQQALVLALSLADGG